MQEVYNNHLHKKIFLKEWKEARVVLLKKTRKKGGEPTDN